MVEFRESVHKTYAAGTYRSGPLLQISVVGTKSEEAGDHFPQFINILEEDPFLYQVMPWGPTSILYDQPPQLSNDGPILWVRPGEQVVPSADLPKSPIQNQTQVSGTVIMLVMLNVHIDMNGIDNTSLFVICINDYR